MVEYTEYPCNNIHEPTTEEFLNMPFTKEELDAAINSAKEDSTPGLDQICYKLLENTPYSFREILPIIINEIIEQDSFPEEWHNFLMILLPKGSIKNLGQSR